MSLLKIKGDVSFLDDFFLFGPCVAADADAIAKLHNIVSVQTGEAGTRAWTADTILKYWHSDLTNLQAGTLLVFDKKDGHMVGEVTMSTKRDSYVQ